MKTRIVKRSEIGETLRFDGGYHNAEGNIYYRIVKKKSQGKLSDYCIRIFTSGRNRRIYTDSDHGFPFLSNADASSANPFMTCKYSSRKFGFDKESVLLPGMILTGRVGAIGQTVFVPNHWVKLNTMGSDNIIRIQVKENEPNGFLYAFLASSIGKLILLKHSTGGVQPFITDSMVGEIPVPKIDSDLVKKIDGMIKESARLREEAAEELKEAEKLLKEKSGLTDLTRDDYNYFGSYDYTRKLTCYSISSKDIGSITFNAFNHSEKIRKIKQRIPNSIKLSETLLGHITFSTGTFPRIEVKAPNGVKLINQSDAFNNIIDGKNISKRKVDLSNLVEYGEVMVAGVGTLGENESFCRVLFANEDFIGQLISGEFIRMKTNGKIPAGYIYIWLNSDYGFRLIRGIQTGTKLCRPIPKLFLDIPIPVLQEEDMNKIDSIVRKAHTKRHQANTLELEAISLVESEIEKWTKE